MQGSLPLEHARVAVGSTIDELLNKTLVLDERVPASRFCNTASLALKNAAASDSERVHNRKLVPRGAQ
jgi:hypothetical protein